jgi:hypothetical protein
MKSLLTTMTLAGLAAWALCGCGLLPSRYHYHDIHTSTETNEADFVTVEMDGDVRQPGQRRIKRELSKDSILEAGGGLGGLSKTPPTAVTLIRAGQKQVIPFAEMGQGKWKDFQLQEGDRLVVNFTFY